MCEVRIVWSPYCHAFFSDAHNWYYWIGKALEERKAEIRIQFKEAPGSQFMFAGQDAPCNELVMRLQPDQAVYFKVISG